MRTHPTDILVIGSGIAGLFYAIHCAAFARVTVVTKSVIGESNTMYAQGGIAAVTNDEDSIENHVQDTLRAGDGLCNEAAVRLVAEHAPSCIAQLEHMSVRFDRNDRGDYDLHREGGHSHSRVLHAKDATGREVEGSLVQHLRSHPSIEVLEHHFVVDIMQSDGRCRGACVFDIDTQDFVQINASITMLASGGGSQVYLHNTNPRIATGDGYALARRAGVELRDMEFVQFHPTSLYSGEGQTFLISEAVRGFGAQLCHADGTTFMHKYHPMASLAPRDVVSRAITSEMRERGTECVYLDLRHLDLEQFAAHFPNIYQRCCDEGLSLDRELLPVVPAAHYFCGGLKTDLYARTSLPQLYSCGEAACTGVHGANRLASNSLLEGLVFAEQAALDARRVLEQSVQASPCECIQLPLATNTVERANELRKTVQTLVWEHAGIQRSLEGLQNCSRILRRMRKELEDEIRLSGFSVEMYEVLNLIDVGLSIGEAASARTESVGCHWLADSTTT